MWSIDVSQPYGASQPVTGIALSFYLYLYLYLYLTVEDWIGRQVGSELAVVEFQFSVDLMSGSPRRHSIASRVQPQACPTGFQAGRQFQIHTCRVTFLPARASDQFWAPKFTVFHLFILTVGAGLLSRIHRNCHPYFEDVSNGFFAILVRFYQGFIYEFVFPLKYNTDRITIWISSHKGTQNHMNHML
jgi:hypothetical protein